MIEFELADDLLVSLEDRDREPEDGLHSFGKDEIEYGTDQLEWEAISANGSRQSLKSGFDGDELTRTVSRTTDSHTWSS